MFVVVTGPPASGKSTLAVELGQRLGQPVLAKDEHKKTLVELESAAGVDTVEWSRSVGVRARRSMLAVARELGTGVIDSVWPDRDEAVRELSDLPGDVLEVHCRTDLETLRRRFAERAPSRPAGFLDTARSEDELWPPEAMRPLAGPWPVVEVDTTGPVNLDALVGRLPAAAHRGVLARLRWVRRRRSRR